MRKTWIAAATLSVVAALAFTGPAARALAAEPQASDTQAATAPDCSALASELTRTANDVKSGLTATPPTADRAGEIANGLRKQVSSLIDLGCLPAGEPSTSAPANREEYFRTPFGWPVFPSFGPVFPSFGWPMFPPIGWPVFPPIGGGSPPNVAVCTDLTQDLLDAVNDLMAALLAPGGPDLTAALNALMEILDALAGLTSPVNGCLPPITPVTNQ